MDYLLDFSPLVIVALAAAVHASFQLSLSMMTIMSGHALGKKSAHKRVLKLLFSFTSGAGILTMLFLSSIALLFSLLFTSSIPAIVWVIACGLSIGIGVATWAFYYRHKQPGTVLWLPRPIAEYLHKRCKSTKQSAEAFGLGMSSVIGELVFIIAPLSIAALILIELDPLSQILGILLYSIIAIMPLLIIAIMIGGGHSLSRIQKWREQSKQFLQFIAGSALIVIGSYLYVTIVLAHLEIVR
jgi:hypothetical protein